MENIESLLITIIYFDHSPKCCVQIVPKESALYSKPVAPASGNNTAPAPLPFCSLTCLRSYQSRPPVKNAATDSTVLPPASFFFSPVVTAGAHPFVGVPIIIENPSLTKSNKVLLKCRRKSGEGNLDSVQRHKTWRNVRWMKYSALNMAHRKQRLLKQDSVSPIDEATQVFPCTTVLKRHGLEDGRVCQLCGVAGDASEHVQGRLLNKAGDAWLHVNCVLWCFGAYETVCGSLVDTKRAFLKAQRTKCTECQRPGAGIPCYEAQCGNVYHLPCAHRIGCSFHSDRSMFCPEHRLAFANITTQLDSLQVPRRVYIERDEDALVARLLQGEEMETDAGQMTFRVGTMVLHSVGQLLPEQLSSGHYHNRSFIYPVGFHVSRFYWSPEVLTQRALYDCRIEEWDADCALCEIHAGKCHYRQRPRFVVELRDTTDPAKVLQRHCSASCAQAWKPFLEQIALLRAAHGRNCLKLFPDQLPAEHLFGLNEPHVIRAVESLPGWFSQNST
ncbi:Myeloid lymphoid or mixed-lineage leukemia 2 [Cichlidogyrus casuarinus]|uniref:Myeloid lymphoid or mixed-lineage leukemia 2 n=1 Tax=Cichlidogyrus casuarinus TaxID=1844966 RepID=A0ABD2QCX0_9PLAT